MSPRYRNTNSPKVPKVLGQTSSMSTSTTMPTAGDKTPPAAAAAAGAASTDPMLPMMEHPQNIISSLPLINSQRLLLFTQTMSNYSQKTGQQTQMASTLARLQTQLSNLQGLANLCRLAILGHPKSFERVRDEMRCLESCYGSPHSCSKSGSGCGCRPDNYDRDGGCTCEDSECASLTGMGNLVTLASVLDLFSGASFISKDQPGKRNALICAIVNAVEEALAFPVTYADEVAVYQGEGMTGRISIVHAEIVVANAAARLLGSGIEERRGGRCVPELPGALKCKLRAMARMWMERNPVDEFFALLSGPKVCRIVRWEQSEKRLLATQEKKLQVGDTITLLLEMGCRCCNGCRCEGGCEGGKSDDCEQRCEGEKSSGHRENCSCGERCGCEKSSKRRETCGCGHNCDCASSKTHSGCTCKTIKQQCACSSQMGQSSNLAVMFCPHQPATVIQTSPDALQVTVPANSRTGPIAIVSRGADFTPLYSLMDQYLTTYGELLDYTVLSMVSMDTWAYPQAFCRPIVRIKETVSTTTPSSNIAAASAKSVGKTLTPISSTVGSTSNASGSASTLKLTVGDSSPAEKALKTPATVKPDAGPATGGLLGYWDAVIENALGIVGVHAVVLRTGKVLYWAFDSTAVNLLNTNAEEFQQIFSDPNLGSYQIFDPSTGSAGPVKALGRNSFCAGQIQLEDGTILVVGGQDGNGSLEVGLNWWDWADKLASLVADIFAGTDNGAHKDVRTYDPITDVWTNWPELADGRYYPTASILNDGTAFIAGGLSNLQQWTTAPFNWAENDQFELIRPGELLAGPTDPQKFKSADQYPIVRQIPGSQQLFVHIDTTTSLWDLTSSSFVADFAMPLVDAIGQHVGSQTYPMQTGHVLLPMKEGDQPRFMIVGGSTGYNFEMGDYNTQSDKPALLGAFIFEYNATTPSKSSWRLTKNPPTVARLLADTVLLPDGTVFVVNGISGGAAAGHSQAVVFDAEIFDPSTETFGAAPKVELDHPRGYHSTAVLLPDGRVAIAGNTMAYNSEEGTLMMDDTSIQIYNPPYLSVSPGGDRPVVTGVPDTVGYATQVNIDTSGGPVVTSVMMMRPCAVTHSVDMDQRAIQLVTTGGAGTITINIPTDRTLAPPGYYMLFFLSGLNVPSIASFVLLKDQTPRYPEWDLGTYSGEMVVEENFDGDCNLVKIDQHAKISLTSNHGSISINEKIDQHSYANLTAATGISIGQMIDQHSIAQLTANGGDITFGQMINEYSEATISATGKVDIGQKIDQHSNATISANTVHIGQKIDQHSYADITSQGDVNIDEKIDQHSTVTITSVDGNINIGQGISGNAYATLIAVNGVINIGQSVDGGCTLNWKAKALNCPHQDGTITQLS